MTAPVPEGPIFAALKLKNHAERMMWLVGSGASTDLIEKHWKLIEEAYNELRHSLEKKVSEG